MKKQSLVAVLVAAVLRLTFAAPVAAKDAVRPWLVHLCARSRTRRASMNQMRRLTGIAGTLALVLAVSLAAPAGADPGSSGSVSSSPSPVERGPAGPTPAASPDDPSGPEYFEYWRSARAHAVALVLATDPRFAGLPDHELQRRRSAAEFSFLPVLGSHYRVLSTDADLSQQGWFVYRTPASWLIGVTLTRDCVEPTSDTVPLPDPCAWRHSWYYRVQPDDTVTLLFDEGDPDDG